MIFSSAFSTLATPDLSTAMGLGLDFATDPRT
jgi:hypothetical protein